MEAKKMTITCKNCREQMLMDFNTAHFSSEIKLMNRKKSQKRTYIVNCPNCNAINTVSSEDKSEWGSRKAPNMKFFVFSGMFSCLMVLVLAVVALYFAIKGLGFVLDWLFA